MVETAQVKIEVERVINIITALKWSKVEERLEGDTITVTIQKKIVPLGGN
jgi:hypothetical protein